MTHHGGNMKKILFNTVLDLGLQFLIAFLAILAFMALGPVQKLSHFVVVDLDGYVNLLQKDWQAGKINEPQLKKTLANVRRAIALIPAICPNTIVIDSKAILAGDAVIHINADDLESLDDLSPNEQQLYLRSILRCKQ